jgi:hypothetical protein
MSFAANLANCMIVSAFLTICQQISVFQTLAVSAVSAEPLVFAARFLQSFCVTETLLPRSWSAALTRTTTQQHTLDWKIRTVHMCDRN